jgi:hypothetical protein
MGTALPSFATADDLAARMLPRTLTDEEKAAANVLLQDVSMQIRAVAGYQQISRVDNDTVTLRGSGTCRLVLPQRPVLSVSSVAGLASDQWEWDGGVVLTRLDCQVWRGAVIVTYSHGLDVTDVAYMVATSVACDAVKRAILNPEMRRSQSIDDYSETLTDARASLLDGEAETIRQAFGPGSVGSS